MLLGDLHATVPLPKSQLIRPYQELNKFDPQRAYFHKVSRYV